MKTYKGIDIALYQGNPDFAAVKAAVELLRQKSGEDADKADDNEITGREE